MAGPLEGIDVVEIASIGPGPFAGMLLADLGAAVIRVDRPKAREGVEPLEPSQDALRRGRRSIVVDLTDPDGRDLVLRLVDGADILLEGFRPGVMERLGLGPDRCLDRNPRLVYGRATGWGQDGPLARAAGHDIDYIALAGVLHAIGRRGEGPVPPLNLVGDFGGGGMLLAVGVLAALVERATSGRGQVVDAAMIDGAALLMTMIYSLREAGFWRDERGTNRLDTGAPFYDVYETRDGKWLAVGAIEPRFYASLLEGMGLAAEDLPEQMDRSAWPDLKARLAQAFRQRTRDEWCDLLDGQDACVAPVLSMAEAPDHPHNRARGTFIEVGDTVQPTPAPRFGRTPAATPRPPPPAGAHTNEVLLERGLDEQMIAALRERGVIR